MESSYSLSECHQKIVIKLPQIYSIPRPISSFSMLNAEIEFAYPNKEWKTQKDILYYNIDSASLQITRQAEHNAEKWEVCKYNMGTRLI